MKNISQIIKCLQKRGFRLQMSNGSGTKAKLYPPEKEKEFYSIHLGERAIHPLKRFARDKWGLDLEKL